MKKGKRRNRETKTKGTNENNGNMVDLNITYALTINGLNIITETVTLGENSKKQLYTIVVYKRCIFNLEPNRLTK